jgi:hypothetical protein
LVDKQPQLPVFLNVAVELNRAEKATKEAKAAKDKDSKVQAKAASAKVAGKGPAMQINKNKQEMV